EGMSSLSAGAAAGAGGCGERCGQCPHSSMDCRSNEHQHQADADVILSARLYPSEHVGQGAGLRSSRGGGTIPDQASTLLGKLCSTALYRSPARQPPKVACSTNP